MERVKKLSQFQYKILSKALSYSDDVRYISYSTCSIYQEEDEQVVKQVLAKAGKGWKVATNFKEIVEKSLKMKKDQEGKDRLEKLMQGIHISDWGARFCHHCSEGVFSGFFCVLF